MWLMLQQDDPQDFVVATGETHSVREFCELAFARAGMPLTWRGQGVDEVPPRRDAPRARVGRCARRRWGGDGGRG